MDFDEMLIEEIRNHKCIYDKRNKSYRNVLLKAKIWNDIGKKLGQSDQLCQKKWKTIRDRYTREIKKKNLPSGRGANSSEMDWELMPQLEFLGDVPTYRRRV